MKGTTREISDLSKRFLAAIDMVGYTGYQLSKEIDVISSSILTHIRTGRNDPSTTIMIAFLNKFPTINGHWLLTGIGQPTNETLTSDNDDDKYTQALHGIPVREISKYIRKYEDTRGFDKDEIFRTFLDDHIQNRLYDAIKAIETKVDQLIEAK